VVILFSLFYTPGWFSGWDLAFDAVGIIVALLIAGFSWRVYKLSDENKFAYFSLAFILVSIAILFKVFTQGLVYFAPLRDIATSVLAPAVGRSITGVNNSVVFYRAGFLLWMMGMLGAWLLIFFISQKKEGRLHKYYEISQIALFIYLIVLISIVSNFQYYVFFLTSSVILGMTVLNYYKNYLNTNKNKNAFLVMLSFLFLLIGNMFFIFVFLYDIFYVFGELFLLLGFLLLLYTYSKISMR